MTTTSQLRRLPIGAEVLPEGGVHFRVWAPKCRSVAVVPGSAPRSGAAKPPPAVPLEPEAEGYFSGFVAEARNGTIYSFRLDDKDFLYPDPASRSQPAGPEGPSQVVDPRQFQWTDSEWRGVKLEGQVIYELHVGTFTPEGTWEAATHQLPELANFGVTLVEVMPIAEFPGSFGWGYDGVDLFAPTHLYGTPDDFRRFVAKAHSLGVGVILDVVYNHLGPVGNYLWEFSRNYFTDRYASEWTDAVNFDGEESEQVREFCVSNARYWVDEFHLDGLRFDATQAIFDHSPRHILAECAEQARRAAWPRTILLIAENEPQNTRLIRPPDEGGYGLDALWNDDFHHSAMVALTGRAEAYYQEYRGSAQELISAAKWGFLYQGQRYTWQKQRRGAPTFGIRAAAFINCLENHDQTSNSAYGIRAHRLTSPGQVRAMTALLLLIPGTPMLFQGQEFAASSPFLFFADTSVELARAVRSGRMAFLSQFRNLTVPEIQGYLHDPSNPETFRMCKLDLSERETHHHAYSMHRDLLRLRREDHAFSAQRADLLHGAVLADDALVLRFFGDAGGAGADDRLLLVNLGRDLHFDPAPEPLLAPPLGMLWHTLWSSENPRYGGSGTPPLDTEHNWRIPGHAAVVLHPKPPEGGANA